MIGYLGIYVYVNNYDTRTFAKRVFISIRDRESYNLSKKGENWYLTIQINDKNMCKMFDNLKHVFYIAILTHFKNMLLKKEHYSLLTEFGSSNYKTRIFAPLNVVVTFDPDSKNTMEYL